MLILFHRLSSCPENSLTTRVQDKIGFFSSIRLRTTLAVFQHHIRKQGLPSCPSIGLYDGLMRSSHIDHLNFLLSRKVGGSLPSRLTLCSNTAGLSARYALPSMLLAYTCLGPASHRSRLREESSAAMADIFVLRILTLRSEGMRLLYSML